MANQKEIRPQREQPLRLVTVDGVPSVVHPATAHFAQSLREGRGSVGLRETDMDNGKIIPPFVATSPRVERRRTQPSKRRGQERTGKSDVQGRWK